MLEMIISAWLFMPVGGGMIHGDATLQRYQAAEVHMGTPFQIVLYSPDEETANRAFRAAFARIGQLDRMMSDFDPDSELSGLGRSAPHQEPVRVSPELWEVLGRAQQLSEQTEGAFDVTVGPLSRLWRRARRRQELPSSERVDEARAAVGYRHVRLDPDRRAVQLLREAMRLDLGAIAKGYAADQALATLRDNGTPQALVDAGGDLAIGEPPPGQPGWKVGLAPLKPKGAPSRFVHLARCGVATSGDAWQFVELGGRRYSHIFDPRTGWPLTERIAVTVVAPDCMTADSLASAVSVLGPETGLELIEQTPDTAALILQQQRGQVRTLESKRWPEGG